MPRALPIDATSFCELPKFPETKICQQLYRPPRASQAQAGHHYIFVAHIFNFFADIPETVSAPGLSDPGWTSFYAHCTGRCCPYS